MEPYETYAYAESGSMAPSGASIDSARLLMLLSKHPPDAIFAIEEDPPQKKNRIAGSSWKSRHVAFRTFVWLMDFSQKTPYSPQSRSISALSELQLGMVNYFAGIPPQAQTRG